LAAIDKLLVLVTDAHIAEDSLVLAEYNETQEIAKQARLKRLECQYASTTIGFRIETYSYCSSGIRENTK